MKSHLTANRFATFTMGIVTFVCLTASLAHGQTTAFVATPVPQRPQEPIDLGKEPAIFDSGVGYIDSALPQTQFRIRYDSRFDWNQPSRSEFFWAWPRPNGSGRATPEANVDDQLISTYVEYSRCNRLSVFAEVGVLFSNPQITSNETGLADMNAGIKYAFFKSDDTVLTAQLKAYFPTGDADRGLGNDHFSLEPGLLYFQRLGEKLKLEGEFKYWFSIDGTSPFAGSLLQYGTGLGYDLVDNCSFKVTPVAELVGWTLLDGRSVIANGTPAGAQQDADGDTILNLKFGVRVGWGERHQLYAGYGHALTGEQWYNEIARVEYRFSF